MNAGLAFGAIRNLLQSEVWLSHTWQVIGQVETIMNSAKDAGNWRARLRDHGRREYLRPFSGCACERMLQEVDQFATLTSDNPNQKVNVEDIARHWFRAAQAIGGRCSPPGEDKGFEAARHRVLKGDGIAQMNHLRAVASRRAEAEERHMLVLREDG